MSDTSIRILLVEDNPGDARLVQILLEEVAGREDFAFTTAADLAAALARLKEAAFDVVLLDLSLPDSQGLDTVRRMREAAPQVPIVVLTGFDDESLAIRAMQEGAEDYLVKGQGDGDLIRRAIRYSVERFRAEQNLRASEARFRGIFENTSLGVVLIDRDRRLVEANPAFHRMMGREDGSLRGALVTELAHPGDLAETEEALCALFKGERERVRLEKRFVAADGRIVWARTDAALARSGMPERALVVGIVEDVTDRKHMEDELRMTAQVFENTNEGIFVTDAEQRIVHVNPAFEALTGYSAEEAQGQRPEFLGSGRHDEAFYAAIQEALATEGRWQGEVWNRRKSGETLVIWLDYSVVRDSRGEIVNHVAVFNDITARKQTEERLAHQVNHDPLTDLPNRVLFHERLERALARAARGGRLVALMFLDLDGFKNVNDVHGHLVGDKLLQSVAERLRRCTRQGDTVARIAGDEFTIILEDMDEPSDVAVVAEKVLHQFQSPFAIDGLQLPVTTSIGISLYPMDAEDPAELIRLADDAMYEAKSGGRNCYRFHSPSLNVRAAERMSLESALERALGNGEFRLHYQGIRDIRSGRLVGVEALLRWQPPGGRLLDPTEFLPALEESEHIIAVGEWVLRQACLQARAWQRKGLPDLQVAVNLSPLQLFHRDLAETVSAALRESGMPAELLELEFPETAVADQSAGEEHRQRDRAGVLEHLRGLGARIAIGGFGTGHASFARLRQLPVQRLKIDTMFVRDLGRDTAAEGIVGAMIAMAHSLDMEMLAVGVERPEQLDWLRSHACDLAQGHLFERPCDPEAFEEMVLAQAEGLASGA